MLWTLKLKRKVSTNAKRDSECEDDCMGRGGGGGEGHKGRAREERD